jgi:isopenicillin N synthase-like dioxygenase
MLLQSSIPLVDLSQDEATAARQVYAACRGPGFFYAANHGIPQELLTEVFRQMRAAFAMPEEAKMAMLADENNRGCEQPN